MNIRRSYFELVERDSENVSLAWKVFSILFYLGAIVSGIICSCSFAFFLDSVGGNCILFSSLTFNSSVTVNLTTIAFDAANSEWGKSISCTFCLCVPVVSILFGLSWATFFLMCGKGGHTHRGLSRPWRIVYPALFFNAAFSVVALSSAILLTTGFREFCINFTRNMHIDNCELISRYKFHFHSTEYISLSGLIFAEIFGWVNAVSWMLGFVTIFVRCLCAADFELVHVSEHPRRIRHHEKIVKITEPEPFETTPSRD